ncbi:hypothetical protein A2U01_0088257 [Trifolium medium]|uniref:Uncharacterized protein n=1 Tax=Trifolium medium TaxID=97028 RepID=A0A392U0W7_9FABA|nr:hypothetical protein [Trifolium medium]
MTISYIDFAAARRAICLRNAREEQMKMRDVPDEAARRADDQEFLMHPSNTLARRAILSCAARS